MKNSEDLRLSVIIPARNAEATLQSVLAAVRNSRPSLEVIVVDDGSSDRTAEIASASGARVFRMRYQMGAGYCRNYGARMATGDVFIFLDADVVPATDYLEIIEAEISSGAGGVGGRYLLDPVGSVRANRLCELQEVSFWESRPARAEVETLYGGLCAFSKSAWNSPARTYGEVKYFARMASGEDCFVCEEIRSTHRLIYRPDLT
ncbi:MAG: glycosyltransferase family 2 protein, partial [Bdellovibrionia bacterium]